jgi:sulfite reductase alpha subunit-like flavoprotein
MRIYHTSPLIDDVSNQHSQKEVTSDGPKIPNSQLQIHSRSENIENEQCNFLILYGTQTGLSEEFANSLSKQASERLIVSLFF